MHFKNLILLLFTLLGIVSAASIPKGEGLVESTEGLFEGTEDNNITEPEDYELHDEQKRGLAEPEDPYELHDAEGDLEKRRIGVVRGPALKICVGFHGRDRCAKHKIKSGKCYTMSKKGFLYKKVSSVYIGQGRCDMYE